MRPEFSLAHLTVLGTTPTELIEIAAGAGYDYASIRTTPVAPGEQVTPLAGDPAMVREVVHRLADTGIRVLDVELARLGPDDHPDQYLQMLEVAAEVGARHVIGQLPDPDRTRATERFGRLCDLAHDFGLTVDLEFPSWTETPNLAEATRVLRAAAQPNAGILIDLLHFARSDSSIAELRDLPPEWFHFAHVCDAPAEVPTTQEGLIHTARFERLFPGEGGIDLSAILSALPPGIPYALEIPHAERVAQFGAKEHARLALTATRHHLDPAQPRTNAA